MASFGLVFNQRVRFGVGAGEEILPVGCVELDASIEEQHSSENEITQYPVEQGVDISDHVKRLPDRLTLRGMVTDTPIKLGATNIGANRSIETYQDVIQILDDAETITIVTTLKQYENMMLKSVDVPRNARLGHAVEMSLSFRQIQTAEVTETQGTTDLGRQNTRLVA